MPPWLDWLDWLKWDCIGAGIIGKILGVWFSFCVSTIRKLFRFLLRDLRGLALHIHNHSNFEPSNRQLRAQSSYLERIGKMAISTLLTLVV